MCSADTGSSILACCESADVADARKHTSTHKHTHIHTHTHTNGSQGQFTLGAMVCSTQQVDSPKMCLRAHLLPRCLRPLFPTKGCCWQTLFACSSLTPLFFAACVRARACVRVLCVFVCRCVQGGGGGSGWGCCGWGFTSQLSHEKGKWTSRQHEMQWATRKTAFALLFCLFNPSTLRFCFLLAVSVHSLPPHTTSPLTLTRSVPNPASQQIDTHTCVHTHTPLCIPVHGCEKWTVMEEPEIDIDQLAATLEATLSPDQAEIRNAEQQLTQCARSPNRFADALLCLLENQNAQHIHKVGRLVSGGVKCVGCVCMMHWLVPACLVAWSVCFVKACLGSVRAHACVYDLCRGSWKWTGLSPAFFPLTHSASCISSSHPNCVSDAPGCCHLAEKLPCSVHFLPFPGQSLPGHGQALSNHIWRNIQVACTVGGFHNPQRERERERERGGEEAGGRRVGQRECVCVSVCACLSESERSALNR